MDKFLNHYGTPRHSGRYPWGSGENPYQSSENFLWYIDKFRKEGKTDTEIAKLGGMYTTQLRAKISIANAEIRKENSLRALELKDKGYSNVKIGEMMNKNESSVRALLDPVLQARSDITETTATMLKEAVAKKKYIDVGLGVENHIGVSRTKLKTAIAILQEEGYTVHYIQVDQLGSPGNKTSVMVLAGPDVEYTEVYKNKENISIINDYSEDGGRSFLGLEPVKSIDSNRIQIRYNEEGGNDKDGVIELRRGVEDISLGESRYAQVRIGVDDKYYLKGMAVYSDKMPKGVDIIFNTKKNIGTPIEKVFKPFKEIKEGEIDDDNPFGSTVRQKHYIDNTGKEQLSALNIVYEEGDWDKWSRTISSQVLSKQLPSLAKKQLGIAFDIQKDEFTEIMDFNNPAVKKKLLDSFADDCDASAAHLKAARLPRQASHVILPFTSIKENEIYAPNYNNNERVVLIRHPHGGIFEIPELIVNNKNVEANKIMHNAVDAIGINPKVAARMSGADFDGDTVLVIPNNKGLIKTSKPIQGLLDFDPQEAYPGYEGMPVISARTKQLKMGDISNLITDMTIKGAPPSEIVRAVKHSMVVIDAEKHKLNYTKSYVDNGIPELKTRYQGGANRGAATLISRAKSEQRVDFRKDRPANKETGEKVYEYTGETYINKNGKEVKKTLSSNKMNETSDAFTLSSGTPMEIVYAEYANKLKALSNQSRKEALAIVFPPTSPSAKKLYSAEVDSLKAKLNIALKNKPLERQAQIKANYEIAKRLKANPLMEASDLKKMKGQALMEARLRAGAKKQKVDITNREWEAIQAGATSNNLVMQVLNNTDLDRVKALATPRSSLLMTPAKISKAKAYLAMGYTQAEVADVLGVSTSTLMKAFD